MRIAIVAAHPDDEIMAAGALLRRKSLSGDEITVIHCTDGAPRNGYDVRAHGFESPAAYARARRLKLVRALDALGIFWQRLVALDFPDQELARNLVPLTEQLAAVFAEERPELILTHAFEGGHPDHDSAAFGAHHAVARLPRETPRPELLEFALYNAGGGTIRRGEFLGLPAWDLPAKAGSYSVVLTDAERDAKRRARDCFQSQAATLAPFPLDVEQFRRAPEYQFGERPHAGRLCYEHYDWGADWERWRELAREARARLRAC